MKEEDTAGCSKTEKGDRDWLSYCDSYFPVIPWPMCRTLQPQWLPSGEDCFGYYTSNSGYFLHDDEASFYKISILLSTRIKNLAVCLFHIYSTADQITIVSTYRASRKRLKYRNGSTKTKQKCKNGSAEVRRKAAHWWIVPYRPTILYALTENLCQWLDLLQNWK